MWQQANQKTENTEYPIRKYAILYHLWGCNLIN